MVSIIFGADVEQNACPESTMSKNEYLFISVIALKLGELYTCCPKTNRYCVLKGERLAISCASRPFLRGRFDYS